MSEGNATLSFHKKNGALHWRKCAEFYGAKQGATAREWYRCGAPIEEPKKMRTWLQAREDERLRKIAEGNKKYLPKEPEIIRLHVAEKMGTRAISRYFNGRPSGPGVREILIRAAVYRGEETYRRQIKLSEERKATHLKAEKEQTHRLAVCLWRLRKGVAVETTCKENGWSISSVWNGLARCKSYTKYKARKKSKRVNGRRSGKHYSRIFRTEAVFQSAIEEIIRNAGIGMTAQARLHRGAMTRVDIKLDDGRLVELKVGLKAGQCYEFIGQAYHYRKHAKQVVLCIPSDLQFREDLYELIVELGVIVCNETTLIGVLDGKLPLDASSQVIPQKASLFVCKCCGSSEKRRRNSCCVDCAPLIPEMRFDVSTDRWVKRSEETS